MGYVDGLSVYRFAGDNPIARKDPSGLIQVQTQRADVLGNGGFDVHFNFRLDKEAKTAGYIIQRVTYTRRIQGERPVSKVYWEAWYVKAGDRLVKGRAGWGYTDRAYEPAHPDTAGDVTQSGQIKWFGVDKCKKNKDDPDFPLGETGSDMPRPPSQPGWGMVVPIDNDGNITQYPADDDNAPTRTVGDHNEPMSGWLPSTTIPPKWWNDNPSDGESIGTRSVHTHWETGQGAAQPAFDVDPKPSDGWPGT